MKLFTVRETLIIIISWFRLLLMKSKITRDFENFLTLLFSLILSYAIILLLNFFGMGLLIQLDIKINTIAQFYFWQGFILIILSIWQWHVWSATLTVSKNIDIWMITFVIIFSLLPLSLLSTTMLFRGLFFIKLNYFDTLGFVLFISFIQPLFPVLFLWVEKKLK